MGNSNLAMCFGNNTSGQTDVTTELASGVMGMSAGIEHTCMWKLSLLQCFGSNSMHQLDIPIAFGSGVDFVDAGSNSTCVMIDE